MSEPRLPLREFQARLAQRLQNAATTTSASKLGILAGGAKWLVDLSDIIEVIDSAAITPVPWAKPWFGGVANVRGTLYGCTDLAAFLGLPALDTWTAARLLLAHPRHGVNAALGIEQTLGLRNPTQMQAVAVSHPPSVDCAEYLVKHWRDEEGYTWHELDLARLLTSPRLLDAAR